MLVAHEDGRQCGRTLPSGNAWQLTTLWSFISLLFVFSQLFAFSSLSRCWVAASLVRATAEPSPGAEPFYGVFQSWLKHI